MQASSGQEEVWYFREEIVSSYESWYEGKGKRADFLEKQLLEMLLSDFTPINTILEVGCGTAHFTRFFESLGIGSVGLDLSSLMLREGKRHWGGELIEGVSHALPFADKSFDFVAFITCMEYMPNPSLVLREAYRVARKGVVWGIMNRWSLPTLRRRIQVLLGKNPFYKNAHFFSILEAKRILRGVFGEESRIRWKNTVFPPFIPLKHSSLPFGAFLGISIRLR